MLYIRFSAELKSYCCVKVDSILVQESAQRSHCECYKFGLSCRFKNPMHSLALKLRCSNFVKINTPHNVNGSAFVQWGKQYFTRPLWFSK